MEVLTDTELWQLARDQRHEILAAAPSLDQCLAQFDDILKTAQVRL